VDAELAACRQGGGLAALIRAPLWTLSWQHVVKVAAWRRRGYAAEDEVARLEALLEAEVAKKKKLEQRLFEVKVVPALQLPVKSSSRPPSCRLLDEKL
jgi:hypothetical protein